MSSTSWREPGPDKLRPQRDDSIVDSAHTARILLESLFPPEVVIEAGDGAAVVPLHPLEAQAVQGAAPRRRGEFAAGRDCARRALARLGVGAEPVLAGPDRAPVWPVGIIGSISHSDGLCAAAVARRATLRGIGLDIERRGAVDASLAPGVCTPCERAALPRHEGPSGFDRLTLLFSAKESCFKCLYPLRPVLLDFQDVEIDLDLAAGSFRARMLRADEELALLARGLAGRFAWDERHVFTATTAAAARGEPLRPR